MKLILNDIKYLCLQNIKIHKNRIYYDIDNIRINGLYIKIIKNMNNLNNKYKVFLDKDILIINNLINKNYNSFIHDINNPSIEIIKNDITEEIYNNNEKYIIIGFMSINDNYYPKIHILPWNEI